MPSINLDLDYFEHPKTLRLVGLLGKGTAELPIRLWCKVGKHHAEGGNLAGYSTQEIESLVGWWGRQGKFVEAMVRVGFMEQIGDGFKVHDWKDHNGHIYAYHQRAKKARAATLEKVSGRQAALRDDLAPTLADQSVQKKVDRELEAKQKVTALIAPLVDSKQIVAPGADDY